jgi:hypothetical protein
MDAKRIISLSLSSRSESPPIGSAKDVRRRLQSNHPHTQKIYQGYGAYYVDIYVGSPPQRQTVLVDTGSENTGIPCSDCVDCGHDHTDPSFNQILSDSFQYLQCSECHMGRCDVNDNTCKVRSEYAEQSAWEGKEIQDNVYLGASDTGKFDEHNRFHAKLFCMESVGGAFREQLANGIMGLGATKGSFWRQMYDQGFIESKQFSICLDQHPISRSMVGRLTLGGVDERLGHTASTMNYMDFSDLSGYYEVKIRQVHLTHKHGHPTTGAFRGRNIMEGVTKNETITIDADERMMNQGGVIIDSGTTGTLLTPEMKGAFDEAWEIITGKPFPVEPIQISPKDLQNWPTVVLQMRGSSKTKKSLENNPPFPNFDGTTTNIFDDKFPEDVVVALPPSHYMLLDLDTQKYIPTIKFDGAHGEGRYVRRMPSINQNFPPQLTN